ncbi:MAG: cofactor-independent phosphoglycerate mutase [Nitrospinae bacterium]|nr:cofactor-independent phosphoglycerate mutase [Nitrospinota bacterium]
MSSKKYVILLGDGMPDWPSNEHGGKTPLMMAVTPNLNRLAKEGTAGSVMTTPDGYEPGSDVTNMSILGYDPRKYYTGRAPLEAAAMGLSLAPADVAFRCNLVTLRADNDGVIMDDFSAGHIETDDAREIIEDLGKELGDDVISFHPGVSYRHLMVWKGGESGARLTPPHDLSDKPITGNLPKGPGSEKLLDLMNHSQMYLKGHRVNARRRAEGKKEANSVWFWGQGKAPSMPTMMEREKLSGAMISAVDLMRGLGTCAGLRVIKVPGATGWIDTNYEGKAQACLDTLKDVDFVFVHVESPDEAGHAGSWDYKVQAISDFDKKIVGPIVEGLRKMGDFRVMALSDHPTPVAHKTHTLERVVFAIYPALEAVHADEFDERIIQNSPVRFDSGVDLWAYFREGKK